MKAEGPEISFVASALLWAVLLCMPAPATAGARPLQDVGLITQLTGRVTCKGAGSKQALAASAFMKIRQGDQLELEDTASLKLIFFSSGRQETWSGPAAVRIEAKAGKPIGKARPAVQQIPAQASEEVRRIPEILKRRMAMTRPGSLTHRGADAQAEPVEVVAPSQADLEEIAAAERHYTEMRAVLPADDITPELTLIGLLDVLEQHGRALEVARKALERQPSSARLKDLVRILSRSAQLKASESGGS